MIWYGKPLPGADSATNHKVKNNTVYFQTGEEVYEATLTNDKEEQEFHQVVNYWEKLDKVQQVFFLQMKASGKELDPKYFNAEERKAFQASDTREWGQWLANNVVRRVPKAEVPKIPRGKICR